MDGFLKGPPSNTPQNTWSQACTIHPLTRPSPDHSAENALTWAYPVRVGGGTWTPVSGHPVECRL